MVSIPGQLHNFVTIQSLADGRAELRFDLNQVRWPWLSLPASHPVLQDKYLYFSTLTVYIAQGQFDDSVLTALTQVQWKMFPTGGDQSHPDHGIFNSIMEDGRLGFELTGYTAHGNKVFEQTGRGRDFPIATFRAMRAASRAEALATLSPATLNFAAPDALGLDAATGVSFVTAAQELNGERWVEAQVDSATGFHPQHPFHTGTGDHVNAGHLLDCALQAAHAFLGGELECVGGQAKFKRYVELDLPFSVRLLEAKSAESNKPTLKLLVSQAKRENALIELALRRIEPAS